MNIRPVLDELSRLSRPARMMSFLAALLFAAALGVGTVSAQEDQIEAKITQAEGTAAVLFSDSTDWVQAEAGMPLSSEDRVRTGDDSNVEIATNEGTVLRVDSNSEVEVGELKPESSVFSLSLGSLVAKVLKSLQGSQRVEVHTPAAVVAVRGTEFSVDVNEEGHCQAGVFEGQVAVQQTDEQGKQVGSEESLKKDEACELGPARRMRRFGMDRRMLMRRAIASRLAMRAPGLRRGWKMMSPQERLAVRQAVRRRWAQLPTEKRQAIRARLMQRWQNLPPEKRERIKEWQQRRREQQGMKMERRGERMQRQAEKMREQGHPRAAERMERRGEQAEKRGERMQRQGGQIKPGGPPQRFPRKQTPPGKR